MGNVAEGLHAAALGGTWQAVVRGFLGVRAAGDVLCVSPRLPRAWQRVTVKVRHRGGALAIDTTRERVTVEKLSGSTPSTIRLGGRTRRLSKGQATAVDL